MLFLLTLPDRADDPDAEAADTEPLSQGQLHEVHGDPSEDRCHHVGHQERSCTGEMKVSRRSVIHKSEERQLR